MANILQRLLRKKSLRKKGKLAEGKETKRNEKSEVGQKS